MNKNLKRPSPYLLEFHVSRQARERYQFAKTIFGANGNVIFADFRAARIFAQKMNEKRDLKTHPELAVRAGQVNAMGLIDEIMHQIVEEYRKQKNPNAMGEALEWIEGRLDSSVVDMALLAFIGQFPPRDVYQGLIEPGEYLRGESQRPDGRVVQNREIALEEMLMLWLANANPAFEPFGELFEDTDLENKTVYPKIILELERFFETQPKFGPDHENLIQMLQAPARVQPRSLSAQLEYIRRRWGGLVATFLRRLLTSLDVIREEEKPVFGFGGQPQSIVYEYKGPEYEFEAERFSQDVYWMPNLVLMAKNTYVWLDQLARKYRRQINRLDQVPDEELEMLARWGFTGLWLIGLWERSRASQKIKQLRGNPEAVASAYSLFSYDIAADLGGEEAYQVLRDKAGRFGIRLASDMVPNHMGIDSRWVVEHPDWFVQLNYPPFPTYSFNGPNLSWDERVGLFLEDHYYDNSDAAVVFKRLDSWTGEARYIYHGNDGTSMPWNDTAQLNYLIPEVREAVVQTILHVARKFPIIRFDAAMTLAKRHYQRLWFPEPGAGGDIPSRSEHGMTKEQFDQAFPEEFWRMVVDRVAQEAPDTLLLAEAFWLMEGYFVRTLGMHRVYNSAFMNMLRDEKNQEYRLVIKNTMEFDPEILKRFVNFMNNPDERTAVDQFGKGDKYFGICTMMATMPGLPMFGHGQVEGFAEKYGMEFRYPKWHEQPDVDLVNRHERQVFPLMRRRYLFAEAQNFRLYDFYTPEGYVNEDVFAYSNQAESQRTLVVFHNRFAEVHGWVRLSAAYPVKSGFGDEKTLVQTTLSEALGLHDDPNTFTIFRDYVSGLEYIRSSQALVQQGMYLELNAYRCLVFLDFREIQDDEAQHYAKLNAELNGRGVPDVDEALLEYELRDLLAPYRELVNAGMLDWLYQNRIDAETYEPQNFTMALKEADQKLKNLLVEARKVAEGEGDLEALREEILGDLEALLTIAALKKSRAEKGKTKAKAAVNLLLSGLGENPGLENGGLTVWGPMLCCLITGKLGKTAHEKDYMEQGRKWIDELLLGKQMSEALQGLGLDPQSARRSVDLARILVANQGWLEPDRTAQEMAQRLIEAWLVDDTARRYLRVHPYNDMLWFNREAFEELIWWTYALEVVLSRAAQDPKRSLGVSAEQGPKQGLGVSAKQEVSRAIQTSYETAGLLRKAMEESGYQVERLSLAEKKTKKPQSP